MRRTTLVVTMTAPLWIWSGCQGTQDLPSEQIHERQKLGMKQQQERQELTREQQREQHELAEEQHDERTGLAEEHREERFDALEDVREDLRDESRTTDGKRKNQSPQTEEVRTFVSTACDGLPVENAQSCPVQGENIRQIRNIENGVELRLIGVGTKEEVEQKLTCYQARIKAQEVGVEVQPPLTAEFLPCPFGRIDLETKIENKNGSVRIQLTTDDPARVDEIRADAQRFRKSPYSREG